MDVGETVGMRILGFFWLWAYGNSWDSLQDENPPPTFLEQNPYRKTNIQQPPSSPIRLVFFFYPSVVSGDSEPQMNIEKHHIFR